MLPHTTPRVKTAIRHNSYFLRGIKKQKLSIFFIALLIMVDAAFALSDKSEVGEAFVTFIPSERGAVVPHRD